MYKGFFIELALRLLSLRSEAILVSMLGLVFLVLQVDDSRAQNITRCDELAAFPYDPQRIANGVYDEDMDIQTAINSCEQAISAEPNNPRLQFQLGRAYWVADQEDKAIELFRRSADGGDYAASYAFLGMAYEYGFATGTPETQLARSLYQIALDLGFDLAKDLIAALPDDRPMVDPSGAYEVDFSGYYQPQILQNIYEENFDELNDEPLKVVFYLRGMYDFFKQEVNWFDLKCAHLHDTRLTQKVVRNLMGASPQTAVSGANAIVEQVLSQIQGKLQTGDLAGLVTGYMEMQILPDEGKRDAGHLVSDHDNNCEANTIKRLYKNAQYYFLREMTLL